MFTRYIFLVLVSLVIADDFSSAQQMRDASANGSFLVVAPGTILNHIISAKDQFHYTEFTMGTVFFRDGNVRTVRMNYNRLNDEMHFITQSGDTLAIDNEATIKFISIGSDTFYYDQGYIMLVASFNGLKLGEKHGFKIADKKKETGYGMLSSASSVTNLSMLDDGKGMYELKINEQQVIVKATQYYFGDKYNYFVLANEESAAELFPNCTAQLKKFCRKNKIHFKDISEIKKVILILESSCR